jgi:hypothetical protein
LGEIFYEMANDGRIEWRVLVGEELPVSVFL